MRLAIADPPYLGRAARWYGGGRGSGGGRHRADYHPEAAQWDDPARHRGLVKALTAYDGWAIALTPASLGLYLEACPTDVRVLAWHCRNAPPSGSRIRSTWEPVIVYVPKARRGRGALTVDDVLDASAPRIGFSGAKPAVWTRWVLDILGHDPETDTVADLFPGSGSVSHAVAQGVLL